jgi:hypothetical protein
MIGRKKHMGPRWQTVYYLGWGGKSMPRIPVDPVPEAEARSRRSFYKAIYDDAGRLAYFEKSLDGALEWATPTSTVRTGRFVQVS